MTLVLLRVYDWFAARRWRLWSVLLATLTLLCLSALRLRVSEDPFDFFSADASTRYVLRHLDAMESVTVALVADSALAVDASQELLIAAGEGLAAGLDSALAGLATVSLYHGPEEQAALTDQVYADLPHLLTPADYARADTLLTAERLRAAPARVRELLLTPAGEAVAPYVARDPLMLAAPALERLRGLAIGAGVSADEGYLMSADAHRLLLLLTVAPDLASDDNARVSDAVERLADRAEAAHPGLTVYAYGAPLVSAANARQVRADERSTLTIALVVLALAFLLVFRSPRSVALLLAPVAFGALFALALIAACHIRLSLVALGVGSVVLGIALSYSIHMVSHAAQVGDARRLLAEMAWPMTVGSLTTIGAFVALLLTDSVVLRHLGLFAALTLVGALLFSLLFLPHLLRVDAEPPGPAMRFLEALASRDYSRAPWIVAAIAILFIVCLFFFTDVRFNADLSTLNYVGTGRLSRSLCEVERTLGVDGHQTSVVVTGRDVVELSERARALCSVADTLAGVRGCQSVARHFLPTAAERGERDSLWLALTRADRVRPLLEALDEGAAEAGFAPGAFEPFHRLLTAAPTDSAGVVGTPLFARWLSLAPDGQLLLHVALQTDLEGRDDIIERLVGDRDGVVPTDMGYFSRSASRALVNDFNVLLAVSSAIVALALLLAYRNLELFLLTMLPMAVSWVIILGLMALAGVEFNVVNIILSTFIFGVGDDYSIFILDGLQSGYSRGRELLRSHKTAILLSCFAALAGLGAQVFGLHPAVRSLGLISIFGLTAVLVVSFVVQPALWRWLIAGPARRGFPWSLRTLARSIYVYGNFGLSCLLPQIILAPMMLLPATPARRRVCHQVICRCMRLYLWSFRFIDDVPRVTGLALDKPAIIVANHQSFVDILSLVATSPRITFVVNARMARVPVMGAVERLLDCYVSDGGFEDMVRHVGRLTSEGMSVVVFPEGTRSRDGELHHFRNGAFLLAHRLGLPLRPVVFYGNVYAVRKQQAFHVRPSLMTSRVLPVFALSGATEPTPTQLLAEKHRLEEAMRDALRELQDECDPKNPYFADAFLTAHRYCGSQVEARARRLLDLGLASDASLNALPRDARLVLRGAGCADLALYIALRGHGRRVVAVTPDEEERELARHSLLVRRAAETNNSVRVVASDEELTDQAEATATVDEATLQRYAHV